MNNTRWTDQEINVLKNNYHTTNNRAIALLLPLRSVKAIKNMAVKLGICYKLRKYSQNDRYFSQCTIEACYWAGFIAADGHIHGNKDKVIVQLATTDYYHLEKLKRAVDYTGPIRNYQNDFSGMSVLQMSSKQMVRDLGSLYNITPKKSKTLAPPTLSDEDHVCAFIRGYFDGDGCLSSNWSVVGTEKMIEWIRLSLHQYVNTDINQSIRFRDGIYILEFGGRHQKKRICDWLYRKSTYGTRLDRKYQKVEN